MATVQPNAQGKVTIEQGLATLKARVERGKMLKAELLANYKNYTANLEEVDSQIRSFGVEPEAVDAVLQQYEGEILRMMEEIEELLPADAVEG